MRPAAVPSHYPAARGPDRHRDPLVSASSDADPEIIGQEILAVLRATGRAHKTSDVADAFGLTDDAGWATFEAALAAIPSGELIRARGQGASLQAAAHA